MGQSGPPLPEPLLPWMISVKGSLGGLWVLAARRVLGPLSALIFVSTSVLEILTNTLPVPLPDTSLLGFPRTPK